MGNFFRLIRVLLIASIIPAIGLATSYFILKNVDSKLVVQNIPSATILCNALHAGKIQPDANKNIISFCQEVSGLQYLFWASIIAAIISCAIPLSYWWASISAGHNRHRISMIFPPLLRFSIFILAISIFLQGAILTYSAYLAESHILGQVHLVIIGIIGLGAVIGGFGLIGVAMKVGKKLEMHQLGKLLKKEDAPKLFGFVEYLAKKLGARPPDNIVVGLEPTFYVTSGDVQVASEEKPVSGETLYISAPLSRLLSQEELATVIGHELGHFRGADTEYSMKFAPVYAGLGQAIQTLGGENSDVITQVACLPAVSMLTFMHRMFATNEAKVSREREYEADRAGASVGSPFALSVALIKVSLYASIWEHAREQNIHRLNEGKVADNLSVVFQDVAKYDVEHDSLENIMKESLEQKIAHPTDTHPPVSKRLENLEVDHSHITKAMLMVPEQPAIDLIDNHNEIEVEVTMQEHHLMFAIGVAQPPKEGEENVNQLLYATYSLAAAIVCADGVVDQGEISTAEGIGRHMFEDFDPVEFRYYCNNPSEIPDHIELAKAMNEPLDQDDKIMIMRYLQEIAQADGQVSQEEIDLMVPIAQGLGLVYPVPMHSEAS